MGFESRIFISAERFAMADSPVQDKTSSTSARSLSRSEAVHTTCDTPTAAGDGRAPAAAGGGIAPAVAAAGGGIAPAAAGGRRRIAFSSENEVREYQDQEQEHNEGELEDELSPLCEDHHQEEEIPPVVISEGMEISPQLDDAIWDINDIIYHLNAAKRGETSLDPKELARAIRDRIRLRDPTNDYRRTVAIFLKRLTSSLQRIGSENFDISHPSNIVALISSGFSESEAVAIIEILAGRALKPLNPNARGLTSRDRMWYFYLFMQLKLTTNLLNTEAGVNQFFAFAVNQTVIPAGWAQDGFSSMLHQILRRFGSIRVKGLTKKAERKQARNESANADDAESIAGSEFSSATQTSDGPLWKYLKALKTLSELLNLWLEGDALLCSGRGELTEDALLKLIFRFLKRMQCSKTGTFDTDRMYSAHIYEALMKAYWTAKNAGKKLILRLHDTFSALLCATCNRAAAYEWLVKAIDCRHPKGNKLTKDETALINFALSASAMGATTLATCSTRNMEALFLHFFHGNELKVSGTDAAKIQSAIERVAQDLQTNRFEVVELDCHAAPEGDSTNEAEQNGSGQAEQPIAEFRGRGDQHRRRGFKHRGRGGH
jgi:hypothetical protein